MAIKLNKELRSGIVVDNAYMRIENAVYEKKKNEVVYGCGFYINNKAEIPFLNVNYQKKDFNLILNTKNLIEVGYKSIFNCYI